MLQAEADDEAQRELDAVVFSEATCCGCTRFAWLHLGLYTLVWYGILCFFWWMGAYAQDRFEWCLWSHNNRSKGSLKRCARREFWIKAGTMFYYAPLGIIVVGSLLSITWCLCAPCALWCLRAPSRSGAVAPA